MRDSYREQLDDVLTDLVHMAQVVSSAVRSATTALLEADIRLAEQVISDDQLIDAKQSEIEVHSFSLLARQAPVAGELRTVVAKLRMVTELERMYPHFNGLNLTWETLEGVVKHNGHYTLPRATEGAAAHGLLGLDPAGDCLVVAKCEPGLASAVAVTIDRAALEEIVGTVAGEDTIFIAVQERKAQRAVIKKVWELFG